MKTLIDDLDFKRPGEGLPPSDVKKLLGKKVNKNIKRNQMIKLEDLEV